MFTFITKIGKEVGDISIIVMIQMETVVIIMERMNLESSFLVGQTR
jgi:hypothetical protein